PRINGEIGVMQVRLVDERGNMVGVVGRNEALTMASDAGLDLVEIAPTADPPVCKILDFGKYKYEEQKKKNEARKKQKIIEVKEIKLRPSIDDHDYAVKMRSMQKFIGEGDKVKVTMRFRGRELAHQELGMDVLMRVKDDLDTIAKVEQFPRMEGRQMTMVVSPKRRGSVIPARRAAANPGSMNTALRVPASYPPTDTLPRRAQRRAGGAGLPYAG